MSLIKKIISLIKRKNMGLMKLIAELFKFEIIKRDTITSVLKNLTLNINQFYKLELGVGLIKYIYNYISKDEKNKFLEYFSALFFKSSRSTLPSSSQFTTTTFIPLI